MSERTRQRRLHLINRMQELNWKYGPVDDVLPDWLDHMPEPISDPPEVLPPEPEATPPQPTPPPPRRGRRREVWDR